MAEKTVECEHLENLLNKHQITISLLSKKTKKHRVQKILEDKSGSGDDITQSVSLEKILEKVDHKTDSEDNIKIENVSGHSLSNTSQIVEPVSSDSISEVHFKTFFLSICHDFCRFSDHHSCCAQLFFFL
jgi:hypothetical protein